MKHIHHIIPKHAGGTDDPSNLIELTVEEHAAAHLKLYEEFGRIQDKRAWLGLAKIMTGEEIINEILTSPKSDEWKAKNRKPKKNKSNYFGNTNAKGNAGKLKTEEHKKKISLARAGKKREKFSKEWIIALREAKAKEPVRTCPHCGVTGKGANMTRYHFDKCKKIRL
jgi:hypothetical protein